MRYFKTSLAAMLVAYVFSFSALGDLIFSWDHILDMNVREFLTLWILSLVALAINIVAHKVEQSEIRRIFVNLPLVESPEISQNVE